MKISSKLFIGFTIIIFLSIVGFIVNFKLSDEVNRNMTFLNRSEIVIRNSARLHKDMIEMQSGFRGFLLTGNDNFLITYYAGLKEVPPVFKSQRVLIFYSAEQRHKLDSIYQLHVQWVKYSGELIAAKKQKMDPAILKDNYDLLIQTKLEKEVGKKINDEIAIKFREFDKYEYKVREKRRQALFSSIQTTKNVSFLLIGLIVAVGLAATIYITGIISKRISTMVKLADEISKGKFTTIYDNQHDELSDLSTSLNLMSARLEKNFTELEKKNKELDQFAYVVSHDLKAPLRGLYNIFHWIQEDLSHEVSQQMGKYLDLMKGRIERLDHLITGLLDYARIGKVNYPTEQVNMKALIGEITEMIVPNTFKLQVSPKLPIVNTQKIMIQQVFSNLISNAVKYHGTESGTIKIAWENFKDYYQFSVSDDGVGISSEYHEKIFAIFQTLREKNQKESTGIGLAIVKKIIEDQKGHIRVVSEPGKGASFIFTWPKEPIKELI